METQLISPSSWGFAGVWNESLECRPERLNEPRERIWASELGGSMVDRYLKMRGVIPTNPPNPRSLRKFEAGNIWESVVGYVLRRAGILIDAQEYLQFQYPGLLPVTGKLDFIAGGKPDYDKAIHAAQKEFNWLPEFVTRATVNIVNNLKEQYPNGLNEIVLEIKSCSSFMFEIYSKKGVASPQHKLQNFHYLKAKPCNEGHIVYICRDDARILEVGITNPSIIEDDYRGDIGTLTDYWKNNVQPGLEKPLVFDSISSRFSANWKVAYSQYLTMLYGLKNQKEFDDFYKPKAERWNRVLGRVEEGKTLTDNNKQALDEIVKAGFDIDKIKEGLKDDERICTDGD